MIGRFTAVRRAVVAVVAVFLAAPPVGADEGLVAPQDMPGPLRSVDFEQHLGEALPLDTAFVDHEGRAVTLGDYFGERPVVLSFVYYDCPMLCPLTLSGLAKSLGVLKFDVGSELDVVAISIDHGEGPEQAATARQIALERYDRAGTEGGWHFLSGDEEAIRRVADAAGFRYEYLPESDEYAHASGIVVTTPAGTVAQYYYGIEYPPKDVRLAVIEAADERLGSVVDQVLLYCFRYDPALGKYTAVAMRIVRLAGVAFLVALGLFLWIMKRRERQPAPAPVSTPGAA